MVFLAGAHCVVLWVALRHHPPKLFLNELVVEVIVVRAVAELGALAESRAAVTAAVTASSIIATATATGSTSTIFTSRAQNATITTARL
jgi:hypothetical protein